MPIPTLESICAAPCTRLSSLVDLRFYWRLCTRQYPGGCSTKRGSGSPRRIGEQAVADDLPPPQLRPASSRILARFFRVEARKRGLCCRRRRSDLEKVKQISAANIARTIRYIPSDSLPQPSTITSSSPSSTFPLFSSPPSSSSASPALLFVPLTEVDSLRSRRERCWISAFVCGGVALRNKLVQSTASFRTPAH